MNKRAIFLSTFILVSLLTACAPAEPPPPLEISIDMSEYAFSQSELEFQVGQEVTIHLRNTGILPHEIMFGKGLMMMNNLPSGFEEDMFEVGGIEPEVMMMEGQHDDAVMDTEGEAGHDDDTAMDMEGEDDHDDTEMDMEGEAGHDEHTGFMVMVPEGSDEYTITFTVTEAMVGGWEIGCFELDGVHYTSGMKGTVSVIP